MARSHCVGLLASALVLALAIKSSAQLDTNANPSHVPQSIGADSGASCPVGYAYVCLLQAFAADSASVERLFGSGVTSRDIAIGRDPSAGEGLRRRIAKLAKSDPRVFEGIGASYLQYARRVQAEVLSHGGDGVVLSLLPGDLTTKVVVGAVLDTTCVHRGVRWALQEPHALLVSVQIDGRPSVLVIQARTIPRKQLASGQQRFRQGVSEVTPPTASGFVLSPPRSALSECLRDSFVQ